MKVSVQTIPDEQLADRDYREGVVIEVDGSTKFSAFDGEPEDNNLGRNFSDIFSIPSLMEAAFFAGKNGEDFTIEYTTIGE